MSRGHDRRRIPPWAGFVAAGATVLGVSFLLPDGVPGPGLYTAAGGLSAAAVLVAVRRHRPPDTLVWHLVAAYLAVAAGGDLLVSLLDLGPERGLLPSAADVVALGAYVPLLVGLLRLASSRPAGRLAALQEGVLVAAGIGVMAWVTLLHPQARERGLSGPEASLGAVYLLVDILVLAVAARLLVRPGRPVPAVLLLIGGLASLLVADAGFLHVERGSGETPGGVLAACQLASYVLIGAAALHPSMARVMGADSRPGEISGRFLAALGGIALLAPAALLLHARDDPGEDHTVLLAGGTALLLVAAHGRLSLLVREQAKRARQLARQHAVLRRTLADVRRSERGKRLLLHSIGRAREDARAGLAVQLHDHPIQALSAAGFGLAAAESALQKGDVDRAGRSLARVREQLDTHGRQLRVISDGLRRSTLVEEGLETMFRERLERFSADEGVEVSLRVSLRDRLGEKLEGVLYRILEEALENIARHADASHVRVSLAGGDRVEMTVSDDGRGFDPRDPDAGPGEAGFGLLMMEGLAETAGGRLTCRRRPGSGTIVTVSFERLDLGP